MNDFRLFSYEFTPATWTLRRMPDRFVTGTPALVRLKGRPAVVASDGGEIVAVDAWSGRKLWRTRTEPILRRTNYYTGRTEHDRYGNTSPLVGFAQDDATLFTLTGRSTFALPGVAHRYVWMLPRLVGLDPATGKIVWEAEAPFSRGDWTYCAAPMIRGERLYTGAVAFSGAARESVVVCHDRRTGRIIWKRTLSRRKDSPTRTLPLVLVALDKRRLYATNDDDMIAAMEFSDGSIVWKHPYAAREVWTSLETPSPPVVDGARLIIHPQNRVGAHVLNVEDGQFITPEKITRVVRFVASVSSPPEDDVERMVRIVGDGGDIYGDYAYTSEKLVSRNAMAVYDSFTGSQRLVRPWQHRHEGGTIAVTDGIIMVQGTRLAAYTDFTGYEAELTRRMLKDPENTDALFTLIRLDTLKMDPDVDTSLLRYFLHLTKERSNQKKRRELVAKWLKVNEEAGRRGAR